MTIWLLVRQIKTSPLMALLGGFFGLNLTMFWLIVGAMLCLVELFVPTAFTAFMMGMGAFVVALVTMVLPLKGAFQVALWLVLSTAFVYLSHRLMPKRRVSSIENATEAQTVSEILPGETGRVLYEGSSWRARCGDEKLAIAPNQKVYIVGREGTTLIVLPANLLKS